MAKCKGNNKAKKLNKLKGTAGRFVEHCDEYGITPRGYGAFRVKRPLGDKFYIRAVGDIYGHPQSEIELLMEDPGITGALRTVHLPTREREIRVGDAIGTFYGQYDDGKLQILLDRLQQNGLVKDVQVGGIILQEEQPNRFGLHGITVSESGYEFNAVAGSYAVPVLNGSEDVASLGLRIEGQLKKRTGQDHLENMLGRYAVR
jgi:hypothetical protein